MGPRSLKLKIMHPTAKFCDPFSATGAQRPDELSRTALVRFDGSGRILREAF